MKNLKVIEHKNQRVLLTSQLAEGYGATEKMISNNFTRNKDRFKEGKHYYELKGEDLKEFKKAFPHLEDNLKFAPVLYLWTEKGALRHAKILDTDKAWEVYEQLEDTYFKVKENQLPTGKNLLALAVLEAQKVIEDKEKQIEEMKPKYEFATHIEQSENSILVRELAKIACKKGIKTGEVRLYKKLREWGMIYKNSTEPIQKYVDRGYFEVVETTKMTKNKELTFRTTKVTGKGQIYIINRLLKEQNKVS